MIKKVIIIVNGQGGVGKDTICNVVSQAIPCKIVSSIDAIKRIAREGGWNGEKTDSARKFLSDLKLVFSTYNNLPFVDMMGEVRQFLEDDSRILFVHIREPGEIDKFKKSANKLCPCVTLLITRPQVERSFGNMADDNVNNYLYDFIFSNNEDLRFLPESIMPFILDILENMGRS
jgi:hypothetical protein